MPTRTALLEEVIPLTLDGYAYSGRVVHQPNARMAPIVLVGGAFQHQNAWGRLEQGFLEAASVITVDLPGWGGADRLPARYGFDFLAEALDQLLSKVAPAPVNVLGGSYGTAVAYQWVRDHPGRAERMALVGTMSHLADHVRARVERTLLMAETGRRAEFVECVVETMVCTSPGVTVVRRPSIIRCLNRALHDMTADDIAKYQDNSERLLASPRLPGGPAVRVPALVTTGEHDPLSTPALSREAATRLPDARFTTFKDADHLVHLERPAEVVDLMTRFFADEPLVGLEYCHPVEHVRQRPMTTLPSPRPAGDR
ncbi:alpha/beta fold hydrolase [Streptomyces sp. NPDC021096]|uniref:alpha/beta fold hydrolase n=1 Tax=Streptomyces sp. NPDC021096 TaxID=3154792 RepID=UPI0033CA78EC